MFMDLLSESARKKGCVCVSVCVCVCGGGGGGGGVSLSGNEDEPILRGYVLLDHPEFLVIFYKLFQLRRNHRIRNASFYQAIFGKCMPGNYCIKHHTYTHTAHSRYIHV